MSRQPEGEKPNAHPVRLIANFYGRVQGVGFRYTAANAAVAVSVVGYVRNEWDGSVHLVAEGPEEALRRLIGDIQRSSVGHHIREVTIRHGAATGEFSSFNVRQS